MDAGPDDVQDALGPISPELALVDPELARRARELLPDPQERPRVRPPVAPTPVHEPLPRWPEVAPELPERRRRGGVGLRMAVLAIVIFTAGAVSGALLGNHGSPRSNVEVFRAVDLKTATETAHGQTTAKTPLRPPKLSRTTRRATASGTAPRHRRHVPTVWAANVIGVSATVGARSVALVWQPPAGSKRVLVLRTRERGGKSVVVYRGAAKSARDASARPCTGYRYTIVNYDRRGHRSTGVPTSIVTRCG